MELIACECLSLHALSSDVLVGENLREPLVHVFGLYSSAILQLTPVDETSHVCLADFLVFTLKSRSICPERPISASWSQPLPTKAAGQVFQRIEVASDVLAGKLIHTDIPTVLQFPHNFHELPHLRRNVLGTCG